MKISKVNKKSLIDEISFVIEKMKETEEPKTKLYYFSAVYGIMPRIFNLEFDSDLLCIHFVVSSCYNHLNSRLNNPDKVIQLPDEIFTKLEETTQELLVAIDKEEDFYEVLKKFTLIGYIAGGNGYYLYQKGQIKI